MAIFSGNLDRGVVPFFTMWTRPRRTMRAILEANPRRFVIPLAVLAGFGDALDRASGQSIGDGNNLPVWAIVLLCAVVGPLGGLLVVYGGGWLLRLAGGWLGGRASNVGARSAVAWSSVPLAWSLLLWPPELALIGREMFTTATPTLDAYPVLWLPFGFLILLEVAIGIWAFVVYLKALGEAHGFSAWRSLAATVIAAVLVLVPILAVAVPLAFLASAFGS